MKRKKNKRLAQLCLCLMLVSLFVPFLSVPAHAEEGGCWELQEVSVETNPRDTSVKTTVGDTVMPLGFESLTYNGYGNFLLQSFLYSTIDINLHASPLPNSIRPGDTITINFDFGIEPISVDDVFFSFTVQGNIELFDLINDSEQPERNFISYVCLESENADTFAGVCVCDKTSMDSYLPTGSDIVQYGNQLSGTIPEYQSTDELEIEISYYSNVNRLEYYNWPLVRETYLYTWTGSSGQNVIGNAGNTGSDDQEVIGNAGSESGETGEKINFGIIAGTLAKIGGGIAAAGIGIKVIKGLAGKSGGKGKKKKKRKEESGDDPQDERKEEEEKKLYEMRVYKEFGDTIYAGRTVTLSARIVEISASGVERTVPELTQQITISSNDLQVGGTFLSGQYQSAQVTAPEYDETPPSTALVTFRLVAPGGSFTQHMRFKIKQADPLVVWPDLSNAIRDCHLDIIAGDNATYPVRFFFHDVDQEPEKIEFGQYDHYEVTVEPADTMYTYWARIKNRTAPLDNKKIYGYENHWNGGTDYRNHYPHDIIGFTATFKDGLELNGFINIICYPEGMSVYTEIKDDRIPVRAYKQQWYSDMESTYEWVPLRYNCVRRTENGVEILHPEDCDLRYGKLQGDKSKTEDNVAMKYKYDVTASHFEPMDTLHEPTPGATYLMKIDVVWKEKPDDVLTLPFIFILKPQDPMEEWNAEFKKLRQRVPYFSTPETLEKNLAKVRALTPQNTSKYELRLINKAILKEYITYWENEAARENSFANVMERLETTAKWLDFFGDCAFTYIIYYYSTLHGYPGAAAYIDAILSPAKDLFKDFAGRYTVAYIDGVTIDWDGFTKLLTEKGKSALDDVLFEMLPDDAKDFFKLNPVKLKKVGLMISCYMLADFAMNLAKNRIDLDDSEERKNQLQMTDAEFEEATSWTNSIYEALLDTFNDMSLKFITSIVGKNIEKYLEKPNVREKLGKWVSGTLNVWWRGEEATRESLKGAKQAYFAFERRGKANTLKKLSKELSQQHQRLDISTSNKIDKALEELEKLTSTLKKIVNTTEEVQKLQSKSLNILYDDIDKIAKRSESFFDWKKKVQETILELPEKEIANILFSKKWFFNRKFKVWGVSFGMLFDKLVTNGAGKVYDLTTGAMIDQINGLEEDRNAQAEAEQAAAEMEAQVETKKLLAQLLLDVEKAETPEEVEQMVDRFQKEIEPPQDEEQDDDDYAFDSDPEFKTGEDGCTYVVLKFRKSGTNEGYRFEYNLSKMLRNLVDSKLGIEFVKSLFGGSVPELPEGKLPMPDDPPLPGELN